MSQLNQTRPCGCKGCRTCLICEVSYGISPPEYKLDKDKGVYVFCPYCGNKAWPGWDFGIYKQHPNHTGQPIEYSGVYIDLNFLSESEENRLIHEIDRMPWSLSQSGRRKQNFGPKCNFKKKKLQLGDFQGFPLFSKFVQEKFEQIPILSGFRTIEQCSLEYNPEKGASIDPHIDDCWIWGERIVTVNLLSDSVLTMTYNKNRNRYNLDCVENYPSVLNSEGALSDSRECFKVDSGSSDKREIVRIPMPRRSLLVIYGDPRYNWEHRVLREDISERRVCIAYREFTPPYLKGGCRYDEIGEIVLRKAEEFFVT